MARRQNRKSIVFTKALNIPLVYGSSVFLCFLMSVHVSPPPRYCEEMIPLHPCLRLVSNCEQTLSSHTSRRLITMEKIKEPEVCASTFHCV